MFRIVFEKISDHVDNVKNMALRQAALLRGLILENRLHHSRDKNTQ